MKPDSSGNLIDRIGAWLRGLFDAGKRATDSAARDVRRTAHEAGTTVRDDVDDAERRVHDLTDRQAVTPSTGARAGNDLPDLADEDIDRRSDFDDAAGDWETGEETYPPAGTDIDSSAHVHDAVGGEDESADDSTDGIIDTTRDAELLSPGGTEGYQDRRVTLQDQLIVDEGASSDEFDGDEIMPGDADHPYVSRADVEAAAEGYGDTTNTDLANTSDEGTSTLTGSTFTETDVDVPPAGSNETSGSGAADDSGSDTPEAAGFHVVERYNYGMGDLGVGAGTAPEEAWDDGAGPEVTTSDIEAEAIADTDAGSAVTAGADASVSPDATRTEIESQSRGDAVNRSDEATQTPGFGAPETFGEAEAGTTEPSRSATGNELDDEQDVLGTTLDHEAESDAVDEDAANLSGESELTVSDEGVDYGPAGGGSVDRVATFQSGTIAHEGIVGEGPAAIDEEVTDEAYADLPDEPPHATADDAGIDDFAGSDYPSDRLIDPLDGDDFTDAEVPDVPDLDSSAGDLDVVSTDASEQVESVTRPVEDVVGGHLDQDLVGTSDEHVGGEEPEFAEQASRGTDETSFDDLRPEAQAVDETLAAGGNVTDAVAAASLAADQTTGTREAPAGAIPGDGGTEAPEGYPIKGNASSKIYHLPDFPSYAGTKAGFYFATEQDAINAGYRAPGNVRRGRSAGSAADSGGAGSGGVTGDETAHVAPGEIAFDERLSGARDVASQAQTGVVTEAGESVRASHGDSGSVSEVPAGAVRGDGTTDTPDGYPVKGNASSKIYHLPSFPSYQSTKAEFCFATEEDALAAGYRAPGKRNRGRKS